MNAVDYVHWKGVLVFLVRLEKVRYLLKGSDYVKAIIEVRRLKNIGLGVDYSTEPTNGPPTPTP